jgi:geranylgeranyl reductase family protein
MMSERSKADVNVVREVDIIVVGAGPAGSSCATILAQHGAKVLLLDKAKFPREKICGDCINPRSWRLFEVLGVAESLRDRKLNVIDSFCVTNSTGATITRRLKSVRDRPFFSISRSELDMLLLEQARRSGAGVLEGTRVSVIRWDGRWLVQTRSEAGSTVQSFSARYLVGADGRNSLVARMFAGGQTVTRNPRGSKRGTEVRVGVQWHTHRQAQIGAAIEMYLFETGYAGIVNVDDKRANVAMVTTSQLARIAQIDFHAFLQHSLFANAAVRTRFEILDPVNTIATVSPIDPIAHHCRHANAFLIGDAHQTVEPFTGEGVFFALQDGVSIANRLLALLKYQYSVGLHDRHSRFWINQIVSPILRKSNVSDSLVVIGGQLPRVASLAAKSILDRIEISQ